MLIESLVSTPLYILILFIILIYLGYHIVKRYPLSEKRWLQSDFIWLSLSFLGIVGIIDKNSTLFNERKLNQLNARIEVVSREIKSDLSFQWFCSQFQQTEYSPKISYDIQKEFDTMCNWCNKLNPKIDSIINIKGKIPETFYSMPEVNDTQLLYFQERFQNSFNNYNTYIEKITLIQNNLSKKWEHNVLFIVSPILLTFGLAIRFIKSIAKLQSKK